MIEHKAATVVLVAAGLAPNLPIVHSMLDIFGAPAGAYAGAAGGIMLWMQGLEAGDKLARWPSVIAHYIAGVAAAGGAIAYWETLRQIPSGAVGFVIAWGLPFLIPGAANVLKGLPETLANWWRSKNAPPSDKGNTP